MSRNVFRITFSFPVFLGAVLVGCVYYFANRGVADPDIWFHLRNAEYLLKTHHFVRTDMYSYTVAGAPWIDHEWLTEIPYYLAWRVWGLRGIFLLMMCLIEAVMLGTYALGTLVSGSAKSAFLASFVAMFLATVSFGPRTLLFGWIYLIVLLAVLWRYKHHGKDSLWVLPPLFLLWINSHGSWLIGMVALWIFILAGLVAFNGPSLESSRWTPAQLKRLLTVAAISMLALFINPYGYKLVFYPFDLALRLKLTVANTEEWASVDFHSLRGKILLAVILFMLVITVVRKQRWKLEWFVLFLFAFYTSVTYMRFLFLAGIIFSPILASRLDMVPPYQPEKDKPLLNAAFVAAAIAFIIWRFPAERSLAADVDSIYPSKAIGYLQSRVQHDPGRVLNDYLWGGYLILNCRDVPVFIDSREDVFENQGILRDYLDFINLKGSLELLEKHRIRYLLLPSNGAQAYFFEHVPEWHATYHDGLATVFERVPRGP